MLYCAAWQTASQVSATEPAAVTGTGAETEAADSPAPATGVAPAPRC